MPVRMESRGENTCRNPCCSTAPVGCPVLSAANSCKPWLPPAGTLFNFTSDDSTALASAVNTILFAIPPGIGIVLEACEWKVMLSPSNQPKTATNLAPLTGVSASLGVKAKLASDEVPSITIEVFCASLSACALSASALITSSKLVPFMLLVQTFG